MKTVYATPPRGGASRGISPSVPRPASTIPEGLLPPSLTDQLLRGLGAREGMIEEIRLRAGRCATLTVEGANLPVGVVLTSRDLTTILTHLCGGSLYA